MKLQYKGIHIKTVNNWVQIGTLLILNGYVTGNLDLQVRPNAETDFNAYFFFVSHFIQSHRFDESVLDRF